MGGRAFKLSIVILFPGKFWNHLGQFLTPRSNNSESKSFSALGLCCSHGACTAATDGSLVFPAAFPGSGSVCRIAGAGHPQMSLLHLCSLITLCSENTMEKKSSSEHMVAFWKRMSACPVLQSSFYFLACLEKQAGLLSSGVFSKPLAVTFWLLMVLGQRCEGVGAVPLTGTSGTSSLHLGAALMSLSKCTAAPGWALSWSCIPDCSRALEMLLSYERKSYHWCSFNKKEVWLAGEAQVLLI